MFGFVLNKDPPWGDMIFRRIPGNLSLTFG